MKNHSLLVALACCGASLAPGLSYAQVQGRTLSMVERDAIVRPTLASCQTNSSRIDAASIIPTRDARAFPTDRVAKTLNGIWVGQIRGDNKELAVDYFWIIDEKSNDALIIALRNGKHTLAQPKNAATAPKLTYLLCAHEGYTPTTETPMIHEFVKVADTIDDAPDVLQKATGLKLSKAHPSLAELWQGLLASGYFESMPAEAFAGAFFKPIQMGAVANAVGPSGLSLKWDAEYRGGGSTSIKYVTGLPMIGVEHGEFIGTTASAGDYLVSSPGNGRIWKVEASVPSEHGPATKEESRAFPVVCYDLAFDSVTLGPLQ